MAKTQLSNNVTTIVGNCLGAYYYSHRQIDNLFLGSNAPGDPPEGSCADKVTAWLRRANVTEGCDPIDLLGKVLEEYMESELDRNISHEEKEKGMKLVAAVLERSGMRVSPQPTR